MKYSFVIFPLLLLLVSFKSNAQISTPGFIHYVYCPYSYSQADACAGWRQVTQGTSDYFNACATGTTVGVPNNLFGTQSSWNNAYMGLFTYVDMYEYREYIGTTIDALTKGKTYTMSIKVSLADYSKYATNGLGIFFSTYAVNEPLLSGPLAVTPQIDYSSYGVITDKTNWVTLTGTFVADSAYTNLVIGCFKNDANLTKSVVGGNTGDSYYYIGMIGVQDSAVEIKDTIAYPFPNAFTPNGDGHNDLFCLAGDPLTVYDDFSLSVFNRWGERVFWTNYSSAGWNGMYKNVPAAQGVYVYTAQITEHGKTTSLKGNVTLIR
ncbi:hypothetical protein CJD36_012425 [Flavipsychrobacter stenotrophus]|uniref:Gliding motility-associated C-terminal domain-containing protein n=1 Tax=Flavipsychrobacter stenotrophus TaxID=2077091 RepID=A0A2S7SV31_9BACT|nr:gliding motility-associated C-terminal domain-containing protein [Flavipsychrobacter stenotrophus]PQJ10770.1 hypothetical protein CJD36_012425 [Flavipsychrobacter stenotrophus]